MCDESPEPSLFLYKHRYTRRYVVPRSTPDWSERYLARDFLDPIDDALSAEENLRISVATGADGR